MSPSGRLKHVPDSKEAQNLLNLKLKGELNLGKWYANVRELVFLSNHPEALDPKVLAPQA